MGKSALPPVYYNGSVKKYGEFQENPYGILNFPTHIQFLIGE